MRIGRRDRKAEKSQNSDGEVLDLSVQIIPMVSMCNQCLAGSFKSGQSRIYAELRVPYLDDLFAKNLPLPSYDELQRRHVVSEGDLVIGR